jgi:DNA-binding PadR family transcriptional regulator
MGKLEQREKKVIRISLIQKVILGSVMTAGVLTVSLLAPNALQALRWTGLTDTVRRKKVQVISRTKNRLLEKGLLVIKNTPHGKVLRITEQGKKALERELILAPEQPPTKWDGKWRVIIFDIKEKRKVIRNKLRYSLISVGFIKVQNSVWVYPYPCEELISLLKADFKIGKDVLYLIVDQLEGDSNLQKQFNIDRP